MKWITELRSDRTGKPTAHTSIETDAPAIEAVLKISLMCLSYGVQDAVFTSSDGDCFCLFNCYLFNLDYDPNEFLDGLPIWNAKGVKK